MPAENTPPDGLDIRRTSTGVLIRKKWLSGSVVNSIVFAVVWNGGLAVWYSFMSDLHAPSAMYLCSLPFAAAGVVFVYFMVASFVNVTEVNASASGVEVRAGPMPWFGNKHLGRDEITKVIVQMRASQSNRSDRPRYLVMFTCPSGKERILMTLARSDQAEFIADAIRAALNLKAQDS
jgi:hypothetical protein